MNNHVKVTTKVVEPSHAPVVIKNADFDLGANIVSKLAKNETVRGPPGFRPKSSGKLVVGQGRSQAFRPS